jgi:hypothetical protein
VDRAKSQDFVTYTNTFVVLSARRDPKIKNVLGRRKEQISVKPHPSVDEIKPSG